MKKDILNTNPLLLTDAYKIGHQLLYPKGTQKVYSTLTPRKNSYFPWDDKMVVFGYEAFFKKIKKQFDEGFFELEKSEAIEPAIEVISSVMGTDVGDRVRPKFEKLHELGYLPIKVQALPEGSLVPMQVPVLTIENTNDDFYWLPGYLETSLLAETFVTSTVASTARMFKKIGARYAEKTSDNFSERTPSFLDFQFHDFSERGQHGNEAAKLSGMAHLTSFAGTDVLQAVSYIKKTFKTQKNELIGASVLATEHSVMEVLGTNQVEAYRELIENNPSGILSVVSDTYDYWEVVDEVLPELKQLILDRQGKLVIRPDSLDDVKGGLVRTLQSLWNTFGGEVNSKGYKVLDSHVGLLHGEGVTLDNIEGYMDAIVDAGFSTENIVFGVGAYVYSVLASRDSFGQALKATAATVNGVERAVFKDPKTKTESFKKSLKGRVVISGKSGAYTVKDGFNEESARKEDNELSTIFAPEEGILLENITDFSEIRSRINEELVL